MRAGVAAAKARGVKFGRPPRDPRDDLDKTKALMDLIASGRTVNEAASLVGWSRATAYRRMREYEELTTKASA